MADVLVERGCPFVFATGYEPTGDLSTRFDAPVLLKPLRHAELLAELDRLLAHKGI